MEFCSINEKLQAAFYGDFRLINDGLTTSAILFNIRV